MAAYTILSFSFSVIDITWTHCMQMPPHDSAVAKWHFETVFWGYDFGKKL